MAFHARPEPALAAPRAVPPRVFATIAAAAVACDPDGPVLLYARDVLAATARRFRAGFPGLVTYAVKANPDRAVLETLAAAGIGAFDVASPAEIALLRETVPGAALHYNNPVRSRREIAFAVAQGVRSFSLDSGGELDRLAALVPAGAELAVRFKLALPGAAYDFGAKFGAEPEAAAALLAEVERRGYRASLTFHPGTQCTPVSVWRGYVAAAAWIARASGVAPSRLNVGGGFPAHRETAAAPDLDAIFAAIAAEVAASFGEAAPALLCEPGRALVAEAAALLVRVRAVRGGDVFLNDGVYGGLQEALCIGLSDRITVLAPDGTRRRGAPRPVTLFGPTCDSLDRLPGTPALPADIAEGDAVVIHGMGAYCHVTATAFNGYGQVARADVATLDI